MPPPDFTLKFVKDAPALKKLCGILTALPAFALDIETTEWWNHRRERIAIIQIAFRAQGQVKVVMIDALADFDLEPLKLPLKQLSALKIIHNAGFDATRLEKHYGFDIAPVFDTMLAARRNKESRYSLKAQAETHLNLRLDKSAQSSDWSRRPLDARQLHYAALDPYATLLLYESQTKRRLNGAYRAPAPAAQNLLPLNDLPTAVAPPAARTSPLVEKTDSEIVLTAEALALLGIIAELPTRYSPGSLAASVGVGRVGLAGWILDQRLGAAAEPDEETVKSAVGDLCENKLIRLTETRRLEATDRGRRLWRTMK